MSLGRGLGATYRVQLRPGFGFGDAVGVVPYLARLGIETLYLSPIAEAVPGSAHGYDGTDPTRLRAELGGEAGYDALVAACAERGLGICVDHVPNHLATWPGGPWWRQLLAGGRTSPVGDVFDVDWEAGDGKVTLPILSQPVRGAIDAGTVRLGTRDGEAVVLAGDVDLPLAPGTDGGGVAAVLERQHYRLADWHDANDRNYRRFFDVDGLVGIRAELPAVFDRTHALVVELARSGRLSALRVDHVDGLRRPTDYLRRLAAQTGVPILVEKILTGDERLRADWPVEGTTGYETIDDVGGLLVDRHGFGRLVDAARSEGDAPVEPLTVETRRLVATASFPAEVERAATRLGVDEARFLDVATRLGRYRTYLDPGGDEPPGDGAAGQSLWHELDETAVWRALRTAATPGEVDGIVDVLLEPEHRDVALRIQQLTGALMAVGVENTAWYRLAGPLAFCEVGGDPSRRRDDGVQRWHDRASARVARGVHGLVPGTTHDTKRAQDVRSRLYALSEMALQFESGLDNLRDATGPGSRTGLAFETRVAAQLALGVLPPLNDGGPGHGDAAWEGRDVARRLGDALVKGAREAKRRTSWTEPDNAYETELRGLADVMLAARGAVLRRTLGVVVDEALRLGALNSLSAVVLRHSLPGLPDCYQGDEVWNLSLVDPDNRRPVDFAELARCLDLVAAADPGELRRSWRDGRVKQLVTARCLQARHGPGGGALAPDAAYLQLAAAGPAASSLCTFARRAEAASGAASWAVAVVTRLGSRLDVSGDDLPNGPSYEGTVIPLPDDAPPVLTEAISNSRVVVRGGAVEVDEVLATLPVALLVAGPGGA